MKVVETTYHATRAEAEEEGERFLHNYPGGPYDARYLVQEGFGPEDHPVVRLICSRYRNCN